MQQSLAAMAANFDDEGMEYLQLPVLLKAVCEVHKDRRPRLQRKAERVPLQAKQFFAQASAARYEKDRQDAKQAAWGLLRARQRRDDSAALNRLVRKGGVLRRSKKLHKVSALDATPEGDVRTWITDEAAAAGMVNAEFSMRWKTDKLHQRELIDNFVDASHDVPVQFTEKDLLLAIGPIKRKSLLDEDGECVAMWMWLFLAAPAVVVSFFSWLAGQSVLARDTVLQARALGKKAARSSPRDLRVIIPLPARLQILDALLAAAVHRLQPVTDPRVSGWQTGAVPKTQPMDFGFALTQLVEKSLDDWSRGALTQGDIKNFYDAMDLMKAARWLMQRDASSSTAALLGAVIRWQLMPTVNVRTGICTTAVLGRTSGGLTGSRTAGAMGRVPVEATAEKCRSALVHRGFHIDQPSPWIGGGFVDNLFFASHSVGGALANAQCFEQELHETWGLALKDGSKVCMPVAGCPEILALDDLAAAHPSWRFSESFGVLGMSISNDCSVVADVQDFCSAAWNATLRNLSGKASRSLPLARKLALFDRVATSMLDYRAPRWPSTPAVGRALDTAQRRCIIFFHPAPRRNDEPLDAWGRRKSRAAGEVARKHGLWSERHAERVRTWFSHICREANRASSAAMVFKYRDSAWRSQRRLAVGSTTTAAGRLSCRVLTHVNARWEDALRR